MNLYGPHIHKAGMGLDLLERWKPSAVLAMDVDSTYVRKVREKSPGIILVVRVYEDGVNFLDWTPAAWVGRLLAKFPTDKPDYFVTINEPFGHDSRELFERFDIWESEVIRLLQANGTDGLACNFGTGNFTGAPDRVRIPDVFPRICKVANVMGPHDYSWPTLEAGWGWYGGRWFKWYDDILTATGRKMKFLLGECGLTQAIIAGRPDWGWQSGGSEGVTAQSYLATLRWYLEQVVNWDAGRGIVLGLCIFNWYDQFHWSFEHINRPEVVDVIIAMDVPMPPPPEPPNGGEHVIPDRVKIYDFEHGPGDAETRDQAWLESIFGASINVHPVTEIHQPQPGDIVYLLEWINCKAGNASCIIEVKDVNGNPVEGETVIFGWPSADPHGYSEKGWNWTEHGAAGDTEADGHVGPGLSTGSYYSPDQGEKGAHFIWIWDRPSEMVDGVGMLAFHDDVPGANHIHTEYGFRAARWGEEPPTPPEEPVNGDLLKVAQDIRAYIADGVGLLADIKAILLESPPVPPPPPPPLDTAFKGEYYNNITLSGTPVLVRDDAKVDFNWGANAPAPGVNADNFSVRWTATKTFTAGSHRFTVVADDGVRLWVDGTRIIDAWKDQAAATYTADVVLSAGQHEIKMEYYERGGLSVARLSWS